MHVSMHVSEFRPVCICKFVSVSMCLGCRCFVTLMRGVQGLRGGLWKIIFSCFARKALLYVTEETPLNGKGLGWIIQHLQSILAPPHLDTSPGPQGLQAHHGNVDNSQYNAFLAPWQHERLCEHGYVWVCNLVCWIIKLLKCCFIAEWEHVFFFFFCQIFKD